MVLYGMKRRSAQVSGVIGQLIRSRAPVLFVTDESAPRESRFTWQLHCRTAAPGPLFNHVAVLALSHFLATRVIELSDAAGRLRMREIEVVHEALDELQ
jgi:DNA-binding MurR/RpiR family transcriptional regulator